MSERSIACVARSGVITIEAGHCPPGLVPLASSWSRPQLELAVCRASKLVRGNAVLIPGVRADLDGDHLDTIVARFREDLQAELTVVAAQACARSDLS